MRLATVNWRPFTLPHLMHIVQGTNTNIFMHAVARLSRAALEVPVLRNAMVTWPATLEAWREKYALQVRRWWWRRLLAAQPVLPTRDEHTSWPLSAATGPGLPHAA